MKYITVIVIAILAFLYSCNENEFINSHIDKTYAEFPTNTYSQTISYTEQSPYSLSIPYQIFGNSLAKNDTLIVRITSNYFTKNSEYWYDSVRIITPQTIFDTVRISIKSNKIWEGGTFSLQCTLVSKNKLITVSKNAHSCTLYFTRESFINYFTGAYSCFETSTNATYNVSFIRINNDSTLYNTNFWDFPLTGQQLPYVFRKDAEQSIEIPESEWTDKLGKKYTVSGTGTYTLNGTFQVSFEMENEQGIVEHSGKHYFTKK
ncbi:MAG: hypothetical protein BWY22_00421 [Bacteroidetes bacterium ADurb.Bin217]|nr:MAG: hypothetical protein BWY22_00421 [Bacteroidetes bacterium ADurb.Bin217]